MSSLKFIHFVPQNKALIVEFFGKFNRILKPGFNVTIPGAESVVKTVSYTAKDQIAFTFPQVKSEDNAFCEVHGAVQYYIPDDDKDIKNSHYSLRSPLTQIITHVEDTVRSKCSRMKFNDLYSNKAEISDEIMKDLRDEMKKHGYHIEKTMIKDIKPDAQVEAAMNKVIASQRLLDAATNNAEAEKTAIVKRAEAEGDKMKLLGQGVANQRKAIMSGLKEAIQDLAQAGVSDTTEALRLMLTAQRLDAWKELATSANAKVILTTDLNGSEADKINVSTAKIVADAAAKTTAKTTTAKTSGVDSLASLRNQIVIANHV